MSLDHKLVYICPEYPGFARFGGIGVGMKFETEWFAAHGVEVHVVCQTSQHAVGHYRQHGVEVHVVHPLPLPGVRWFTDRLHAVRLARRIIGPDPGLVICSDFTGPVWTKPRGVPLIVQLHGSAMLLADYYGPRPRVSYFERRTIQSADRIQAVSDFVVRRTAELVDISTKDVPVIPQPADTECFQAPLHPPNPQNILFCGGKFTQLKGIFTLAATVCGVFEQFPQARLQIVARDSIIDGRSGKAVFLESVPAQFHDRITIQEQATREEVRRFMAETGILVVPSFVETLSVVAIEAMASARPVVASNRGGLPEVVWDGVSGLLADPDHPATFVSAISTLLRNPDVAASMGAAGRRIAREYYHPDVVFGRVLEFHCQTLEAFSGRTPSAAIR